MSKEIVDIAVEANNLGNYMAFIPSRRQIEYDGGYVNHWDTKSFVEYVKGKSDILMHLYCTSCFKSLL